MSKTILVIDDNQAVGVALELLFGLEGWAVAVAATPAEGLARLANGGVDLVIQDMNFHDDKTSGEEGVQLFRQIREAHADLPIILLTGWTDLEIAVTLVREGAADYLGKPWDDNKLLTSARNLLELAETSQRLQTLDTAQKRGRCELEKDHDLSAMVFADMATENVVRLAVQVAKADIPVLIFGPNGAGKECLAQLVHNNSLVNKGAFVAINCGALPNDLLEAELFGAEAGAYTGATKSRVGRFEAADKGTLFLDEIGNLTLEGQMKLLRVLETGQFERLGSNTTRRTDVRVISATNADLPAMIAAGTFREDLYYRLNVIELTLPALADRPADIIPLSRYFAATDIRFSDGADVALQNHAWPGNVRELRNAVARAQLLCTHKTITEANLGLPNVVLTPKKEHSKEDILGALADSGGVISDAAAELGLSRQALYRRMEKFGLK